MHRSLRLTITLCLLLLAILLGYQRYADYLLNPWTRDGQVRAQVIQITPQVNGQIVELPIRDNQVVKAGDLLFRIDPRPYQAALEDAEAAISGASINVAQAQDELDRGKALTKRDPGVVAQFRLVQLANNLKEAQALKTRAQAVRDSAQLNLEFTEVRASVDGYVTNLELRLGSQAVASRAALALIDRNSFWVHGFFKESELAGMQSGDRAQVTLMTYPDQPLDAVVDSIGWGIAQPDGSPGHNLLPSVSPTFQWIRLAQRVPVRVHLLLVPEDINLRVGTTASVLVSKQEPTEP